MNLSMKRNSIAVVGIGNWGSKKVEEYMNLGLEPFICDIDPQRLSFIKKKFGIENVTTDYKNFLSDSEIVAIDICTPNETHYEICKDALKSGKHVFLEKPMTLNSRNAEELVKIAKKNDLVLIIGHIYRYNKAMMKVQRMIREGFFGKIVYINYTWSDSIEPKTKDIVFDLGSHTIDILHFLLDRYPEEVTCVSNSKNLDWAFMTLQFDDIVCNVELSWVSPIKKREIFLIGKNKSAKVECANQRIFVYDKKNMRELKIERNNTIRDELTHFLDCIYNNKKPRTDGEMGFKIIKVLEFIKKSLKEKRTVEVKL